MFSIFSMAEAAASKDAAPFYLCCEKGGIAPERKLCYDQNGSNKNHTETDRRNRTMKKTASVLLALCLLLSFTAAACAEAPVQNAVLELCSAEGIYTDSVGNTEQYSYHVPQIYANSLAADEMNAEIAERFGKVAESQFENMEGGYSLWSRNVEWHAYWSGTWLFLLITADTEGSFTDYAAYGYDFGTDARITNEMILQQKGITEEEYLENLKEKVELMFEDMYGKYPEKDREAFGCDELLEKTLGWLDAEQPMFLDGMGEVETIVKIASIAGAEWYYHLATPFAYG